MSGQAVIRMTPIDFLWHASDPFIFCVYHQDAYPSGNSEMGPNASLEGRNIGQDMEGKDGWRMYHGDKIPGFPSHPHRGFETVTLVRKGLVDHADSLGAAGRYGEGDTQWLTAGRGVQHSEMFPLLSKDQHNTLELFQIWLNLPSANKMVEPHFAMLWKESIPRLVVESDDGQKTTIDVIAGRIGDCQPLSPPPGSWAANPANRVAIWLIKMKPNATWTVPAEARGLNRCLYYYRGANMQIAGTAISPMHSVDLHSDKEVLLENGAEESLLLFLQGRPIDEPVVQHGPFVMNSNDEIQQAFVDYQKSQFGGWPWPVRDQVHPREKGRFAKHADGGEETPDG